jgi:hypothetical protein
VNAPLLLNLGALVTVAPLIAAVSGRVRSAPHRWVLAWSGVEVLESAVQWVLAKHGVRNLWLVYVLAPLDTAVLLWALSWWQTGQLARLTFRFAIPASVAAFYVMAIAFDSASAFSRAAFPMIQLVSLSAAAATLVARSRVSRGDVLREDWFWICGGMVLYFGTFSTMGPLSRLLAASAPSLLLHALEVSQVVTIVSFLLVAWGIACPAET